jgi:phosphatidylglycerol:prolipoprotein diacylglycerol transferase
MFPVLLHDAAHGIVVYSSSVAIMLAVILGVWLGPRFAESIAGIPRRTSRRIVLVTAAAALVGGRLHFVANHPGIFTWSPLHALKPWVGGYHMAGAIVAALVALVLAARFERVSLLRLADGIFPAFGIAIAVNRVGCFLHGCCVGDVCTGPWCVSFPNRSVAHQFQTQLGLIAADAPASLPVHPLQLYFAAAGLLTTALTLWLAPRRRWDGQVALAGIAFFWTTTALLEGLRAPNGSSPTWGPLEQLHWLAIALAAVSVVALLLADLAHRARARHGIDAAQLHGPDSSAQP